MAECINREIAIERIKCKKPKVLYSEYGVGYERGLEDAIGLLNAIPAADVQITKYGKWNGYICSECNACADYFISGDFYFDEKPNFCPNCGARMDGDAE